MKNKFDNIFYIYGGAIGGLTLGIHLLETMRLNLGDKVKYVILVPKIVEPYKILLRSYPHIAIIELNRKNILKFIPYILRNSLKKNIFVIEAAFGEIRFGVKIVGWLLTISSKSSLYGFEGSINKFRFLFDKIFSRPLELSVYKNIEQVPQYLSLNKRKPINFIFKEDEEMSERFRKYGDYLVIHSFATNRNRSLPLKRWKKLIEEISHNLKDTKILIIGSKKDIKDSLEIIPNNNPQVISFVGNSIYETLHILKNAKLFLGVDTGTTHIASLLGKNVIEIGNMSNPSWLTNYNSNTTVLVNKDRCTCVGDKTGKCEEIIEEQGYLRCMIDVTNEDILMEVKKKIYNQTK